MKNINRNIRVVAENTDCSPGFNIYLDFSGQREFLMFHRRNGLLYSLLRDGICVGDLARWAPGKVQEIVPKEIYSGLWNETAA